MATLTTGFTTAAALEYAGGSILIGPVNNALLSDDTRTAFTNPQPAPGDDFITEYLKMTDLVTKVPFDASVTSVAIKVERRASAAAGVDYQTTDEVVKLVVGGVIQTENLADTTTPWTNADSVITYTFEDVYTAAQLNASDFGMVIACDCLGSIGGDSWPQIDYISCVIEYTAVARQGRSSFGSVFSLSRGDTQL